MDELKSRKTIRLPHADYNGNQAVFLTICTKERRCLLSQIIGAEPAPVGTGVPDGPRTKPTEAAQLSDDAIRVGTGVPDGPLVF